MDKFKNLTLIKLEKGEKRPLKHQGITTYTTLPKQGENYGVLTGETNNIICIDFDNYHWKNEHVFKDWFDDDVEQEILKFDTLTQQTPSGGFHLIFQYDPDIYQTQNSGYHIDVRSTGGYFVGYGSIVKNKQYTIFNDTSIKQIPPKLKRFIIEYITPTKTEISKQANKTLKNIISPPIYKYIVDEEQVKNILAHLPQEYIIDNKLYLQFTHMMKTFGYKKLWDQHSLKGKGYNKDKNEIIWNRPLDKYEYVKKILEASGLDYKQFTKHKYRPQIKNTTTPDRIINRKKLGQIIATKTDKGIFNIKIKGKKDKDYFEIKKDVEIYIIKSDTGTGKTTLFKNYIKETNQPFISIVSRISLATEQTTTFINENVPCFIYSKLDNVKEGDSVITTIDSLLKSISKIGDIKNYVVFLDEFNSMVEYLISSDSTIDTNRVPIFKCLINLLRNCKQVIGVDADISDLIFTLLAHVNRPYQYILNEYKHNQDVETTEYQK